MAITKAMLAKCQNELKQAFCALDADVQRAMRENEPHVEWLSCDGKWGRFSSKALFIWPTPYRLSPDTPTEPEYEEKPVVVGPDGVYATNEPKLTNTLWRLYGVVCASTFLGIIYRDTNGVETLRTSVDAAFGTPVRVRFRK